MRKPKSGLKPEPATRNPVAKFAHYFNKAAVHQDKKHYQRRAKHPGREPFANILSAA
jgi:hypothetical protein